MSRVRRVVCCRCRCPLVSRVEGLGVLVGGSSAMDSLCVCGSAVVLGELAQGRFAFVGDGKGEEGSGSAGVLGD